MGCWQTQCAGIPVLKLCSGKVSVEVLFPVSGGEAGGRLEDAEE